jgi:hypothetical protein
MFNPITSTELATVCGGASFEQPQPTYQPPLQETVPPRPPLSNLQVPQYTIPTPLKNLQVPPYSIGKRS